MPVRVCDDDPNRIGDYTLEERLGDGAYGTVFVAAHAKKKERFAVKRIDFNMHPEQLRATEKQVAREATIMQGLQHQHVVKLIKVMQSNDAFYFIMELAEGGELLDKMKEKKFDEATARRYFQELVSAIHYCHGKNVVHRDLKAENLLLTKNGVLKVCDFGFSCRLFDNPDYDDNNADTHSDCSMGHGLMESSALMHHPPSSGGLNEHPHCSNFPAPSFPHGGGGGGGTTTTTGEFCNETGGGLSETTSTTHQENNDHFSGGGGHEDYEALTGYNDEVGTIGYMPPEMLRSHSYGHHKEDKVDPRTHDLWAAGVILFFMLTGTHPFEGHDDDETEFNILHNHVDLDRIEEDGPRSLVEEMLALDPQSRLSLQEIIDSAWFQQDLDDSLFPESFLAGVKKRQNCRSFLEFKRSPSTSVQLSGPLVPVTAVGGGSSSADLHFIGSRASVSSMAGNGGHNAPTPTGLRSNRASMADLPFATSQSGAFDRASAAGSGGLLPSRSASMADVHALLAGPPSSSITATNGGGSNHQHSTASHNNSYHQSNHQNNNQQQPSHTSRTPSICGFNTPTVEEQRVIRRAFDAIDVDGYGDFITWAQLRDVLILLKGKNSMRVAEPSSTSTYFPTTSGTACQSAPLPPPHHNNHHPTTSTSTTSPIVELGLPPLAQPPPHQNGGGGDNINMKASSSSAAATDLDRICISEGLSWLNQLMELFDGDVWGVIAHEEFLRAWTETSLANVLPKGLESFRLKVIAECRTPGFVPPKAAAGTSIGARSESIKNAASAATPPSLSSAGKSPTSPLPPGGGGSSLKMPIEFSSSGAGSVDGKTRKASSSFAVAVKPVSPTGVVMTSYGAGRGSTSCTSGASPPVFATATNTKHLHHSRPATTTTPIGMMAASLSHSSGCASPIVSSPTSPSAPTSTSRQASLLINHHQAFPEIPSVDDLTATTTTINSDYPQSGNTTMPPSHQNSAILTHGSDGAFKRGSSPTRINSTCATAGGTPVDGDLCGTPPQVANPHHRQQQGGTSPVSASGPTTASSTTTPTTSLFSALALFPDLEPLGLIPRHLPDGDPRALIRVLRRVFDSMDENGDGLVFPDDVERLFEDAGVTDVTPQEIRHLVQHLDSTSHSNCFTFGEFMTGAIKRAFMVSHPLGKRFAHASGLGRYFGLCSGSKAVIPEPTAVATAKFTVVGLPSDVFERISTYSPDRLRVRPGGHLQSHTHTPASINNNGSSHTITSAVVGSAFPHHPSALVGHHHPPSSHHPSLIGDLVAPSHHHVDPALRSPSGGGSPLSNSVTPFSLSGSQRGQLFSTLNSHYSTAQQEPFHATFQFTRGHSPHRVPSTTQVDSNNSSPTGRGDGCSPIGSHHFGGSPDKDARGGGDLLAASSSSARHHHHHHLQHSHPHHHGESPFELRSREGSFRGTNPFGGTFAAATPTLRRMDSYLYAAASPENAQQPTSTTQRSSGSGSNLLGGTSSGSNRGLSPLPCEVDIRIHTASHTGYTAIRMSQKSGTTKDFQEAVEVIAQSLESMRDQAVHDSCTRGDSELL